MEWPYEITKHVQRKIWSLQPAGVHEFKVACLNVHDELGVVSTPEMVDAVEETVQEAVAPFRDRVPLLRMDWKQSISSWADK